MHNVVADHRQGVTTTRWHVLAAVLMLSFAAFIERLTTSVVSQQMMPELGISQIEIGWLFGGFAVGYTIAQFPGGIIGLRLGARNVLFWSTVVGGLASVATGLVPMVAFGAGLVVPLVATRVLLGLAQGPLYPVSSGMLERWFEPRHWALVQGLVVTSIGLGAAVTPPALAWLMLHAGWKLGITLATLPAFAAAAFWWTYAADRPGIKVAVTEQKWRDAASDALRLGRDRNVSLLTLSYLLDNSVVYLLTFWSFLYIVRERHFSLLEGGWLTGVPFVAGALAAAAGGYLCDRLCVRFGARWGARAVPLIAMPLAAVSLYLTGALENGYAAVAALTVSYSCLQMVEGPYWSTAMRIGRDQTMAATGILNTGGNLGGVIMMPIVGYLADEKAWPQIFGLGMAIVLASMLLWLWIDAEKTSGNQALQRPESL